MPVLGTSPVMPVLGTGHTQLVTKELRLSPGLLLDSHIVLSKTTKINAYQEEL